uniref:Uncharacterized protein n=1 Tax=Arundo donax TaxID=35708 RepID=A0A0A9DEL6_ARUDO
MNQRNAFLEMNCQLVNVSANSYPQTKRHKQFSPFLLPIALILFPWEKQLESLLWIGNHDLAES